MKKLQRFTTMIFMSMFLLGTTPLIAQDADTRNVTTNTTDDDDDDDDNGNWGLVGLLGLLGLAGLRKRDDVHRHSSVSTHPGNPNR